MRKINFILLLLFLVGTVSAQNTWQVDGNNVSKTVGKIGSLNSKPLQFITNNQTRLSIAANGDAEFLKNLKVKGGLIVGDSAQFFDWFTTQGGSFGDFHTSDWGNICLAYGDNTTVPAGLPNYNLPFYLGIGGSWDSYKVQISQQGGTSNPAILGFTNNSTGHQNTDGFTLGIDAITNTAVINQQENNDIVFRAGDVSTGNNDEMMRIVGTFPGNWGSVGIGTATPQSTLNVRSRDGEVFRTESMDDAGAEWRFIQGFGLSAVEKGLFYGLMNSSFGGDNDFYIQATSGDLKFNTGGQNPRVRILGTNGFMGIGDYTQFTPQSLLHLNESTFDTYLQFTNNATGSTSTDGFKVGIDANGGARLIQQESNAATNVNTVPIFIENTRNVSGTDVTTQSMIITQENLVDIAHKGYPRIGIGNNPFLTTPLAHLHIGEDVQFTGSGPIGGYRKWMDEGMLVYLGRHYHDINSQTARDNMFVGLRPVYDPINPLYEKSEAIINWGNNPTISSQPSQYNNSDILKFLFTSDTSTFGGPFFLKSGNFEGTEVARMICDGNNGSMGVGGDNTNPAAIYPANPYSLGTGFNPARTLEVNSAAIDPNHASNIFHIPNNTLGYLTVNLSGGTGFSGLRFTDLTSNSTVSIDSSGGKVLSVNDDGDVILISQSPNVGFGAACPPVGTTPFDLSSDWRVGLGGYNLYFAGNNSGSIFNNDIGIGYDCVPLGAKLDILQSSNYDGSTGLRVLNTDMASQWGIPSIGIYSQANGLNSNLGAFNYGGYFMAYRANENIAGFFSSPNGGCINAAGIYDPGCGSHAIVVPNDHSNVIIGWPVWNLSVADHFILAANGNCMVPTGFSWQVSDSSVKKNVINYSDGLSLLRRINPVSYDFTESSGFHSKGKVYGLIAQQLNNIAPYAVDTTWFVDDTTTMHKKPLLVYNPNPVFYMMLNSIKELDSISTGLANKVDSIKVTANNGLTADINKNIQLGGSLVLPQTNINLNDKNLLFSEPAVPQFNTNAVAIGAFLPWSKFSVNNVTSSCAGNFNVATNSGGWNWGIQASSSGGNPNVGGQLSANGGVYNYGLISSAVNGSYANYGLVAGAAGGQYNTAGYFDGDLVYTGNFYKASDSLIKENINPLTDAMNLINQLQPKTFNFKTAQYPYLNLPAGTKYGLIAQDVENVFPWIVTTNIHPEQKDINGNILSPELAYKGLNYEELIPVMIQGMKEQQGVIDSLKNQMAAVMTILGTNSKSTGDNGNSSQNNTQYVELENVNAIILNQNDPNPFAEETNITYYIPENVTDAKLMFYDNSGRIIKTVEITGNGNGTLHVYASNLSSGIYTYALIADGKVIDTKKMMKAK